ncbi:MAG: hypothetical protein IIC53_07285, partial [Proteobacteria bacterium]|nr:hypothetical protein [Pseudomonadota bacterium]
MRTDSEKFNVKEIPEELNETHELMIVASSVDPGTERIVQYLADDYDVEINVVFFRVFSDEGREYLTRAFLREPGTADVIKPDGSSKGDWNGEYYVSFGHSPNRQWSDSVK